MSNNIALPPSGVTASTDQVTADSSQVQNVQLALVAAGVLTRITKSNPLPAAGSEQLSLAAGAVITATTTAGLLIAANTAGRERIIRNTDPTDTAYIGPTAGVSITTGMPLLAGERAVLNCNNALYVITAANTAAVFVTETVAS